MEEEREKVEREREAVDTAGEKKNGSQKGNSYELVL